MIKTNMGKADRLVRILVAIAAAILIYFDLIPGTMAYILLAVAAVFVLTSIISFCPLYGILGLNTCSAKRKS